MGVVIGWVLGIAPVGAAVLTGFLGRRRTSVVLLSSAIAAGVVSGWGAAGREASVLEMDLGFRHAVVAVRVVEDPKPARFGWKTLVDPYGIEAGSQMKAWDGPLLVVATNSHPEIQAGERLVVSGTLGKGSGFFRGSPYAGRISSAQIEERLSEGNPLFTLGNRLRDHLLSRLRSGEPGRALLAGFLVGETSGVNEMDQEALRLAGLSHYVAVSGSNVALFLGLWAVVLGPLGWGPRRRGVLGILGLLLFVVITRWEPSVVRASVMAGIVLGYRVLGHSIDAWKALGMAVTGCLLVSGGLAFDVGFQLSVAATAGVMIGAQALRFKPRALAAVLGASLFAQAAVAPILLARFGTIPLLSPLVNVVAAPLVTASTSVGGVGALLGFEPLVNLGAALAEIVMRIGRESAGFPQIGWMGAWVVGVWVTGLIRVPSRRISILAMGALAAGFSLFSAGEAPPEIGVVFLDVGQGDAALVFDRGVVILVDAGPDPQKMNRALSRYGVDRIDLVVATHVHEDHLRGMEAVIGRIAVGAVWASFGEHATPASKDFIRLLETHEVGLVHPQPGWRIDLPSGYIDVLGPTRRYASPNDESIVLTVRLAGLDYLFSGDVETFAQADLGLINPDVLKVPHQGALTSDRNWIRENAGSLAVISVGPNDFGHPGPEILESLESAGAVVLRTDEMGDVVVDALNPLISATSG